MGELSGQQYEIKCQACGARFRITSKSGAPPAGALPCPKCHKTISLDADQESSWQNMGYEKVFGRTDAPQAAPAKPQRVFTDITAMGLDETTKPAEPAKEEPKAPTKPAKRVFSAPAQMDPSSPISLDILEPTDVRAFLNEGSWGVEESVAELVVQAEPIAETKPVVETKPVAKLGPVVEAKPVVESEPVLETPQKISRSALRERLKKLPRPAARGTQAPAKDPAVEELAVKVPVAEHPVAEHPVVEDPAISTVVEVPTLAPAPIAPPPRPRATMFDEAALARGIEVRAEGVSFPKMQVSDIARVIQRGAWAGAIEVHDPSGEWVSLVLHPVFAHVEAQLSAHTRAALDVVTAEVERAPRRITKTGEEPRLRRIPAAMPGLIEPGAWLEDEPTEMPENQAQNRNAGRMHTDQDEPTEQEQSRNAGRMPADQQEPADQDEPTEQEQSRNAGRMPADQGPPSRDESADQEDAGKMPADQEPADQDEPGDQEPAGRMPAHQNKPAYPGQRRMSSTTMMLIILAVVALTALAYVLTHENETPKPPPVVQVAPRESIQLATLVERRGTIITQGIAALRAKTTEELSEEVSALIQRKNYGDAWDLISELRTREPNSKEWVIREIEISLGSQEWSEARHQAIRALTRFDESGIVELYQRAVQNDSRLFEKPLTLTQTGDFDRIRALGGGRSVSLKMKSGDQTVYAFKPAQAEWGDGWKSEVAAWRLCELISCGFDVPWSRPARISREDLMALYPMDTDKQRSYFERFAELTWVLEPGPDGVEREYLYGVLKTWVPHFADWPIEYTHVWNEWLDAEADPTLLDQPFQKSIRPLMIYKGGEYFRNLVGEEGDATTMSVAKGISDVVSFDYLTNNWDRFSILEQYYGVNNQFADGRFVSIDNGAAFHVQPSIRVDARFEPVERFSRSLIRGLKLLQPNWAGTILFESPSDLDKQRLDVFWQRRDAVLGRVTELVEQHGEQKVLFFD